VPTYQYTCTDCGEPVEVVQKFTDDPLTVCAACGGRLRKVFSPVGIVFKGSGFYRTDSRNGSGSTAVKDKQPSESSSSSSSSSSSGESGSAVNGTGDKAAKKAGEKAGTSSGSSSSSSSSSEKVA
jgi:putative FmdB family regulatory protein